MEPSLLAQRLCRTPAPDACRQRIACFHIWKATQSALICAFTLSHLRSLSVYSAFDDNCDSRLGTLKPGHWTGQYACFTCILREPFTLIQSILVISHSKVRARGPRILAFSQVCKVVLFLNQFWLHLNHSCILCVVSAAESLAYFNMAQASKKSFNLHLIATIRRSSTSTVPT
jgi:hypothetical protein